MTGASTFRRSPLLLLAAALVALTVLVAPGAQPAQAQTTTVWSATLTVRDQSGGFLGCDRGTGVQNFCTPAGLLSDNTFTYAGVDYEVRRSVLFTGLLLVSVDKTIPDSLKSALTLHVDSAQFPLANASLTGDTSAGTSAPNNAVTWTNTGLSWSVGDTVQLSLTEGSSTTTTPTEDPPRPQVFPDLDRLPVRDDVERVPASERRPTGGASGDGYCYIGEGNGETEYIRYPNGRIEETTRQSDAIRSMFACD